MFILTLKIFVLRLNEKYVLLNAMKNKVQLILFVRLLRFPDVVKNKMCYFAIYGLKCKLFGETELFGGLQSS